MSEVKPSICRLCTAYCPILVTIESGRPVQIVGDPEAPLFDRYTCPKGRALPEMHANPRRLLHSLKRQTDGSHQPITSERAIEEISAQLAKIVERHGPRSVAAYGGTSLVPYPALGGMAGTLLRAIGSPMFFTAATIDQPGTAVADALHGVWLGGRTAFEAADAWLFAGANPVISKQYLSQNPGARLKRGVERGTKLIVIDPRRSETARQAHIHLQARPGEDPTLIAGLLHLLIAEGFVDETFVRENAVGFQALAEAVAPFTPDYVASRADIPRQQLVDAARVLGQADRGGVGGGTGVSMATRGNLTSYLLLCLHSIRGFWARAGDPLLKPNTLLPAITGKAQAHPPYPASGFGEQMRVRGLGNSVAGLPTCALAEEILLPGDGQIRALFCVGSSPMMAWPDQRLTKQALESLELLVTTDVELSPTARLAHYVIATKMSLETPGMTQLIDAIKYLHSGYGFEQPFAQYTPALVDPPAGSDLIEDWQLYYRIARRMGVELEWINAFGVGAFSEHPIERVPLDMQEEPTTDDLFELMCRSSRIPLSEVKRHAHGHVFEEARQVVQPRDSGCDAYLDLGNPDMLRELAQVRTEAFEKSRSHERELRPFLLVPRRANKVLNSIGRTVPGLLGNKPYNPAFMHPEDLDRLGLATGDAVEIRSEHGAILGIVEAEPELRHGVVSMSHGFGLNPGDDENPREVGGNTNRLLRIDADYDPITGMPRMGALPVAVRPAGEGTPALS